MRKLKISSIATMLVLAMMLTACAGTPSQGEVSKPGSEQSELPSSSVKPSESDKPDSQLPSQSEDPSEPESQIPTESEDPSEPDDSLEDGWTRLTEEELKWFNERFFNVAENGIVNAFEEYAVRCLTESFKGGTPPTDLAKYIEELIVNLNTPR